MIINLGNMILLLSLAWFYLILSSYLWEPIFLAMFNTIFFFFRDFISLFHLSSYLQNGFTSWSHLPILPPIPFSQKPLSCCFQIRDTLHHCEMCPWNQALLTSYIVYSITEHDGIWVWFHGLTCCQY